MTTPIGINTRKDHTLGTFTIPQSPYHTAQAIADDLTLMTCIEWYIESGHIGGNGDITSAVCLTGEIKHLWQDVRGRWWLQKALKPTWLVPDLDETELLAAQVAWQRAINDAPSAAPPELESSIGNYPTDEVIEMRHPDW